MTQMTEAEFRKLQLEDPLAALLASATDKAPKKPTVRLSEDVLPTAAELAATKDTAFTPIKRTVFDFTPSTTPSVGVQINIPRKGIFRAAFPKATTLAEIRAKFPGATTVYLGTQLVTTTIQDALDILTAPKKKASRKSASTKNLLLKRNRTYRPIRNTPHVSKAYGI